MGFGATIVKMSIEHEVKQKIAYELSQEYPDFPPQWHYTRSCRIYEHFTTPDDDEAIWRRNDAEFKKYESFFENIALDGTQINRSAS